MEQSSALVRPSPDETTMAMLAHVLQIFTWWIGPLVIYLARRESKFVSFHAMQALLWQLTVMVVGMVFGMIWFIVIFASVFSHMGHPSAGNNGPPMAFFFLFPFVWIGVMGRWFANMAVGIIFGVRAGRGEWAAYPVLGKWARKIVEN
jgi:uncharacterized Tic20 family protein